jgi:hypothetical protein
VNYELKPRSPSLLQQLKDYATLINSVDKLSSTSTTVSANSFLMSLGIDVHRTKHRVHIPYGIDYEVYRETVIEHIRGVLGGMGLTFFNNHGLPSPIATEAGVVGTLEFDSTAISIAITCKADKVLAQAFLEALKEVLPGDITPGIKRVSVHPGGLRARKETIQVIPPLANFRAAYPFLEETPEELWKNFQASKSNVLLLIGPPGTGKSSFLMSLLNARGWENDTYLADSDEVLSSPGLVNFIRDVSQRSVVVTEDSDRLVAKREDGNSVMSGLLNATAGLISTDTKFMVSTNLTSLSKVDTALIRPGRTYKVLHFRKLTRDEALYARQALDLPYLDLPDDGNGFTLAEVLNTEENTLESGRQVRQFGFQQ